MTHCLTLKQNVFAVFLSCTHVFSCWWFAYCPQHFSLGHSLLEILNTLGPWFSPTSPSVPSQYHFQAPLPLPIFFLRSTSYLWNNLITPVISVITCVPVVHNFLSSAQTSHWSLDSSPTSCLDVSQIFHFQPIWSWTRYLFPRLFCWCVFSLRCTWHLHPHCHSPEQLGTILGHSLLHLHCRPTHPVPLLLSMVPMLSLNSLWCLSSPIASRI